MNQDIGSARTYSNHPTSWVDRGQELLTKAPLRWWIPLAAIPAVFISLELVLVLMTEGVLPTGSDSVGLIILYGTLPFYLFGLLYFLDRRAEEAITELHPLLQGHTDQLSLSFDIANMPFWPALFSTLVGSTLFVFVRLSAEVTGDPILAATSEATRWLRLIEGFMLWSMTGAAVYHSVRQLRIIDRTYSENVRVNLLDQAPLYGLASISAYTAVGIAVPPYLGLVVLAQVPSDPISLGILATTLAIAALIIIAPLYRLHMELAAEKMARLNANSSKIDRLFRRLYSDDNDIPVEQAAEIRDSVQILKLERDVLSSSRTWPWPSGSIRGVLAALLFPTVIWIIQKILGAVFP